MTDSLTPPFLSFSLFLFVPLPDSASRHLRGTPPLPRHRAHGEERRERLLQQPGDVVQRVLPRALRVLARPQAPLALARARARPQRALHPRVCRTPTAPHCTSTLALTAHSSPAPYHSVFLMVRHFPLAAAVACTAVWGYTALICLGHTAPHCLHTFQETHRHLPPARHSPRVDAHRRLLGPRHHPARGPHGRRRPQFAHQHTDHT